MSHKATNQAGNHSTMERIAARIPGTTEHAERHHPGLTRHGRGNVNTTQTTAGLPPNVNPNLNQTFGGAGTIPGTQQQFAAPTTARQPGFNQRPANAGLGPTTGQKIAGKTQAGMGRLMGNPQMEAQGIQKASGGVYVPAGTTVPQQQQLQPQQLQPQQQPGGYPPANF